MMKKLINVIQKIIILLLAVVLTLNVMVLASKVIFKEDLPKVFGYSQAVVLSGSMSPELEVGDVVLYKVQDEYFVGDVIIFEVSDYFVTHRIIEEVENGFITQGDANNVSDDWVVEYSQIHGKMIATIPNFGGIISFLKTPLGVIILVACGFAVYKLSSKRDRQNVQEEE